VKYLIILLILLIGCKEPTTSNSSTYKTLKKYLIYGMPNDITIAKYVAKEYGFIYLRVAGCIVTDSIINHCNKANKRITKEIGEIYGKNWKEKYDEKVINLEIKYTEAKEILLTNSACKARQQELESKGYRVWQELIDVDINQQILKICMYYTNTLIGKQNIIPDKIYKIDIVKKTVKINPV
jgi:hypothetical protein